MTTLLAILAFLGSVLKYVPQVMALIGEIQKAHQEQLKANQYATAVERKEQKKELAAQAVNAAIVAGKQYVAGVRGDTQVITKYNDLVGQ